MTEEKTKHLKFFGIGRILPFLRKVRKLIFVMILFGLIGSLTDIIIPLFQRYALDHFIGKGTFDTIVPFLILYAATILIVAGSNYISAHRLPLLKCGSTGNCERPVLSICRICLFPISIRTALAIFMPG
jgi:ABC-type bacteriocin/lantibiotic exporter with double-glycine peptidase domain